MDDRRKPTAEELEGIVARVFARRASDAEWIRQEQEKGLERAESMVPRYDELADALAELAVDGASPSATSRAAELGARTGLTVETQQALGKTAVVLAELGLTREQVAAKLRDIVAGFNPPERQTYAR